MKVSQNIDGNICQGDKNVRGRKWECFEALSVITRNSSSSVARDFSGHNQHLIEGARNYDGAEDELLIDCEVSTGCWLITRASDWLLAYNAGL